MSKENSGVTSQQAKDFTNSNTPHNKVIVVQGQNFYVMLENLSFCSGFFRKIFESNSKEKFQHVIKIEKLAAKDFHLFLQALVPGNKSIITGSNYRVLLSYARHFEAYELGSRCENFTMEQFDNLDKIELLKMAFKYDWTELKEKVVEFLIPTETTKNACPKECDFGGYKPYHSKILHCNACDTPFENLTENAKPLDESSFMVQNEEKISALPAEIRAFLFDVLQQKAKQ